MIRKSFATGSRVYGKPRKDSDIDLVVLVDQFTMELLLDLADEDVQSNNGYDPADARCLRFGKLNLLCCMSVKHFDIWKKGTDILVARRNRRQTPVLREEAISFLSWFREKNGIKKF